LGGARSLPPGAELPPARIEPSGYLSRSAGVIEAMSPWMVCPTFSSTLILAISWLMKASVLASVIAAGLAAAGHWDGWAVAAWVVEDWAKAGAPARPAEATMVEASRAEIARRRRTVIQHLREAARATQARADNARQKTGATGRTSSRRSLESPR
jgi:hypothetical protein